MHLFQSGRLYSGRDGDSICVCSATNHCVPGLGSLVWHCTFRLWKHCTTCNRGIARVREREIDRTNTIRLTVCFLNVVNYWQNFAIPWVLRGMYSKNHILCRDSKLALAKINQPLWSTYRYSQKSTQTLEKHACGNISKKYIMLPLASFATL